MSSDRIAEGRALVARCEAAWHEGNATEPAAMELADIMGDLIRWIEPGVVDKEPVPECGKLCRAPRAAGSYEGPCLEHQGHGGPCDPLPF